MEQDAATRRYRIGREVSLMGLARPTGFPLRAIAAPHLWDLGETLGETAFPTIRQRDDLVCLDRAIGSYRPVADTGGSMTATSNSEVRLDFDVHLRLMR